MADYYTLLTNAGIAYETACKAAGLPIKLSQISVGDGGGAVYNPAATDTALKREVWRGPLNALFQDEKNPSWLLAEVTIPPDVGGWYVREAGIWTDTGILYAIVKYPESFKPVLATSGSGKEFYIRSIFETSNAALVTLLIDDTVVKATRAWVTSYVADELAKLDSKQSVRIATTANIALAGPQVIDGVAVVAGDRVLVKNQTAAKDNGLYIAAVADWVRAKDADVSTEVTSGLIVSVEQGATLADTRWQLVTDGAIVLGSTALTFQNLTQGFAPLNSPALISPTATTPVLFDDSKAIATTEFTRRSQGNYRGVTSVTGATTLTTTAAGTLVSMIGTFSVILPTAGSLPSGGAINFRNIGSGNITVVCAGADTINAGAGQTSATSLVMVPGATLELASAGGSGWWASGSAQLQYAAVLGNTPPRFDNTKKLATTEWIKARGVELGGFYSFVAPLTGIAAHVGSLVHCYGSGPVSYSIPDSVANGFQAGATIRLQNWSIATLILSTQGADKMQESLSIPPSAVSRSVPPDTYLDMIFVGDGAWVLLGTGVVGKTAPFGALMSANGYQKLPSGLIIQWMTALFSSAALSTPFNLPIAFPNKNFGCNVSMTDSTIYGSTGSPFVAGMANGLGQVVVQSNYTASQSAVRVLAFGM